MHWGMSPFICRMYPPWHQYVFVKVDSVRISETLESIETVFNKYAPDHPFAYEFMDAAFERQYTSEIQLGKLFNLFSILSIIVACLGLFGLASFTAEQKTKEIGIRKVLGASASSIITLTARDFLMWIAASNVIAWPIAYFLMTQWLKDFVYRISIGPVIFLLAGGLTLFIALFTISYQTLKAALADPVNSLRYE
jgi:putative ABC transport system permease protein